MPKKGAKAAAASATSSTAAAPAQTVPVMPEEVQAIHDYLVERIGKIDAAEKLTPWNKAKRMAFQEILDVVTPTPPAEATPTPEPEVEVPAAQEPAPEPEPTQEDPAEVAGEETSVAETFAEAIANSVEVEPEPEPATPENSPVPADPRVELDDEEPF